ncbi:MAG: toxin-antitoxin system protein [Thiotrichaceae bacterium]|nr:MAG: toxin-antitoxin system protein [Thiotrichaceae bacterium]
MKKDKNEKQRTTIYLPPQIAELTKQAADDNDRSFTKQIESILKEWLTKNKYLVKD